MSFQRPSFTTTGTASPSSASYSEFLKDIYSSLRNLSAGLAQINTRLDTLTAQVQSFDTRFQKQDNMSQNLADRVDALFQQTQTTQIRQSTSGLSLLSELDNLGTSQIQPSAGLAELGPRIKSSLSATNSSANRLSFQIPEIPEIQEISKIIIHDVSETNQIESHSHQPSYTHETTDSTTVQQQGNNFLILD